MSIGIIEIKSAADRTFEKAKKGEIDFEYLAQAFIYYKATDFNPVVFIFFRKETGHMVEIIFDRNCKEKIITKTLTGDAILLEKEGPILLVEIRSPFDESVEGYVRERIKWLKHTKEYNLQTRDWEMVRNEVPGRDTVEDEIENVQGNAKCQSRAKELGVSLSTVTQNGSWWKIPTGRKILGFPCSYCSHMERCFPNAKMEMQKEKPIWVLP